MLHMLLITFHENMKCKITKFKFLTGPHIMTSGVAGCSFIDPKMLTSSRWVSV